MVSELVPFKMIEGVDPEMNVFDHDLSLDLFEFLYASICPFEGNLMKLKEFKLCLRNLFSACPYISEPEKVCHAISLLRGEARTWWLIQCDEYKPGSWQALLDDMERELMAFQRPALQEELLGRVWQENESLSSYFFAIANLCGLLRVSAEVQVFFFLKGLPEQVRIVVSSISPISLEAAYAFARMALGLVSYASERKATPDCHEGKIIGLEGVEEWQGVELWSESVSEELCLDACLSTVGSESLEIHESMDVCVQVEARKSDVLALDASLGVEGSLSLVPVSSRPMNDACITLPCLPRKEEEFSDCMGVDELSSDLGKGIGAMLQEAKHDDGVENIIMMDVRRTETCSLRLLPFSPSTSTTQCVDASLTCSNPSAQHDLLNSNLLLGTAMDATIRCQSLEASALLSLQPWTSCERSPLGMKNGFDYMPSYLPILSGIAMLTEGCLGLKQKWHDNEKFAFLLFCLLTAYSLYALSTLEIPTYLPASRNMEKTRMKLQVAPSHEYGWTVLACCLDYFLPFWWLAVCIKWLHQMKRPHMLRPAFAFFPILVCILLKDT